MTVNPLFIAIFILAIVLILTITPSCLHAAVVAGIVLAAVYAVSDGTLLVERATNPDEDTSADNKAGLSKEDDEDETTVKALTSSEEEYDVKNLVDNVFSTSTEETRVSGDDRLMQKMQQVSQKNHEAILNRTTMNSDNARRYVTDELDEQEKRVWWDDDSLDQDLPDAFNPDE